MVFSFLTVKLKIAKLPENVNWIHMLGASILGGVGFTMAIFVANLAYAEEIMVAEAKLAILLASLFAGVIGFIFLFIRRAPPKSKAFNMSLPKSIAICRIKILRLPSAPMRSWLSLPMRRSQGRSTMSETMWMECMRSR